jgi:nucleotide-binding universal stress UspA family protein
MGTQSLLLNSKSAIRNRRIRNPQLKNPQSAIVRDWHKACTYSLCQGSSAQALAAGTWGLRRAGGFLQSSFQVPGRFAMLPINNILFPTDFSDRSTAAFHVACALARDHRAALTVLHVRDLPTVAFAEFGAVPPANSPSRAEIMEKLNEFEPPDPSVNVEYVVTDGLAVEEIVRAATDRNCDLIVMGTHGRTGLGRLMLGSVAEEVMRKAPCPVLTLKAPLAAAERLEALAATA